MQQEKTQNESETRLMSHSHTMRVFKMSSTVKKEGKVEVGKGEIGVDTRKS